MRTLVLLILLFQLCTCRTQRPAAVSTSSAGTAAPDQPEILFLQLKVWKTADRYGGELLQQRRVAGLLKRDLKPAAAATGQWLVRFLDAGQQVVDQIAIPNPLEEHYETTDEEGQLLRVDVNKPEANCFIRVQYDPRFAAVQIEQSGTQEQRIPIITLNLK